ncbi:MAG TPA: response regulator transcription factor [Nitrospiria bacterium]
MSDKTISVVIFSGEMGIPKQLEGAISIPSKISVVLQTSDLEKGFKRVKELKPQIIIVDLNQVEDEKVPFLIKIQVSHPEARILVLLDEYLLGGWLQIFKVGVKGILEKSNIEQNLSKAILVVQQGGIFIEPKRIEQFMEQTAARVKQAEEKAGNLLTDREIQVLRLLAEGYTVKKAASLLDLSPKTVDTHKANLMRKINVHHRTDLIKYALRKKIISLHEE